MSIEELIEAAKTHQWTEDNVKELHESINALNKKWEEKELRDRIWYNKWLNEPFAII